MPHDSALLRLSAEGWHLWCLAEHAVRTRRACPLVFLRSVREETSGVVTSLPKGKTRSKKPSAAKEKKKADLAWAQYVKARDGRCRVCGRTDGVLHAHHIVLRRYNATRTDETCGLTACFQCHQDVLHGDPIRAVFIYETVLTADGYEALRRKAYDGVGAKYTAQFWVDERARLRKLIDELQ